MLRITVDSLLSRFYNSRIPHLSLLVLLACASVLFCNRCVALTARDPGEVWYESDTHIGQFPNGVEECASAGTIIRFDSGGIPNFIAFAKADEKGEAIVQGQYGIDGAGRPLNQGRLIYKNGVMPFVITGPNDIYEYHLSYLELTTVEDAGGYRAYATKAIAADNIVKTFAGGTITFTLPQAGYLAIVDGKIKIGDNLIIPNYDLTGNVSVTQAAPAKQVPNPGNATGQADSTQTPKVPSKSSYLFIGLGITGAVVLTVLLTVFSLTRGRAPEAAVGGADTTE